MIYLLDTNACIQYINGRSEKLRLKFLTVADEDVVVSTVSLAELYYGAAKSQHPAITRQKQEQFFVRFKSVGFDERSAEEYGYARAHLERIGSQIGRLDMLIAAVALANNLILVTHNVREFSRVEGLRFEDWEA